MGVVSATPKNGLGGGLATPLAKMGVAGYPYVAQRSHPKFFFYYYYFFNIYKKSIIIIKKKW
jgi:hypothetical protein